MISLGVVPRNSMHLHRRTLSAALPSAFQPSHPPGSAVAAFEQGLSDWIGGVDVLACGTGRAAFRLALEALELPQGAEVVFPRLIFPVIPAVAQQLGLRPVFCEVDPLTLNAQREHFAACLTSRTGASVATHLYRPCFGQASTRSSAT